MLKYSTVKTVTVNDFDSLVSETYARPYSFQQQNGCRGRCSISFIASLGGDPYAEVDDFDGEGYGVSFASWLARDPAEAFEEGEEETWSINMHWDRNFYPCFETVVEDLCKKGLIEPGDYTIVIDW